VTVVLLSKNVDLQLGSEKTSYPFIMIFRRQDSGRPNREVWILGNRVLKKVFGNKRCQRIRSLGELPPSFDEVQVNVKEVTHAETTLIF